MPVSSNSSLTINSRQRNLIFNQNNQSRKNINFAAGNLYGEDLEQILSSNKETRSVGTQAEEDFTNYNSNVAKIRGEIDSKKHGSASKMFLELSLTALVAVTTILSLKKGMDAAHEVVRRVTNQGKNFFTSEPIKKFFSNSKSLLQTSFNKVDKGINSKAESSKSRILKHGAGIYNKLKSGASSFAQATGRLVKNAKNSASVKKAAKLVFVTAPKVIVSTCVGSFITLTALENIIEPFMDKIFDKKTAKKKSSQEKQTTVE